MDKKTMEHIKLIGAKREIINNTGNFLTKSVSSMNSLTSFEVPARAGKIDEIISMLEDMKQLYAEYIVVDRLEMALDNPVGKKK